MRQSYERERLLQLGKKELEAEHRRLQRKIRKIDDYELYDDDISESNESKGEDYIVGTPVKRKQNSLKQSIGAKKTAEGESLKKRNKKVKKSTEMEESESEADASGEEQSVFF